jgi:hypothetical protein
MTLLGRIPTREPHFPVSSPVDKSPNNMQFRSKSFAVRFLMFLSFPSFIFFLPAEKTSCSLHFYINSYLNILSNRSTFKTSVILEKWLIYVLRPISERSRTSKIIAAILLASTHSL